MFPREEYLERIKPMINTEFIKIITGVRRSGKSFFLKIIQDELLEHSIKSSQILYMNFEHPDNYQYLTADALYQYIKQKVSKEEKVYFLFDEIQEVKEWQRIVNGLRVAYDSDIYITGSNASLLSGEMATYLTGRFIEIKMQPLGFREFLQFKKVDEIQAERYFREYLEYGGFPSVVLQQEEQLKKDVLSGIYNSILFRDVASRTIVREPEILERIALFLLDNIGQLITVNKIGNTLRSNGRKVSNNTVENYLSLLEQSFLFYKAQRFDIRGKEYLKSQAKYYTVDLGFILSQLKKVHSNRGTRLENLVYMELRRRGYDVFVGTYQDKEIDFVAQKIKETLYIQVTAELPENSNRETDNLVYLPTGHKKLVITSSWNDIGEIDGVQIVHIVDFLLGKEISI